jgi:hypothetical protein
MQRYLVDRTIRNAGSLTRAELREIAQTSCAVLDAIGTSVQWIQSYVTDDRITCVYLARSAGLVRAHARRAGFPADLVMEVGTVIDPTTAER